MTLTKNILIVLDLDETLIHATNSPKDELWDFELDQYKIYKRPGLEEFLLGLSIHFDVAVWSSASDDYVDQVVQHIFPEGYPLLFVWGRSKCTRQIDYQLIEDQGYIDYYNHMNYAKILKKVKQKGYAPLEKTLIIDDTPRKSKYNYGNAIYPNEFNGEQDDKELPLLFNYLMTLKDVANVRTIEKRDWRNK